VRIRHVHVESFGIFNAKDFAFDRKGLLIVEGRNEAGKSTLLELLRNLLFGFPHRTPYRFPDAPGEMLARARLRLQDGRELEIARRKGRKDTVTGQMVQTGDPIDEEVFRRLLGGANAALYSNVFAFSLQELALGEKSLEQDGMREALYGGGIGGFSRVEAMIARLDEEASSLFSPRGKTLVVNRLLSEIEEKKRQIRDLSLRPTELGDRRKALERTQEKARITSNELALAVTERDLLSALLRAHEPFVKLGAAQRERETLTPVPGIRDDALERHAEIARSLEESEAERLDIDEEIAECERRLATLDARPEILESETQIGRLFQEIAEVRGYRRDIPKRRAEADRLRPGTGEEEEDLPADTDELLATGERLLAARDTVNALRAQCDERSAEVEALATDLFPPLRLDAEEAARLPVPRVESLRALEASVTTAEREKEKIDDRLREIESKIEESRRELRRQRDEDPLPLREELERARQERDSALADGLFDALPPLIEKADRLADEMLDGADRHARRTERERELARQEASLDLLRRKRDEAAGGINVLRGEWNGLFESCGFEPLWPPPAMISWKQTHDRLREVLADRRRLETRLAAQEKQTRDFEEKLGNRLRVKGTLHELVSELRRREKETREARARRDLLESLDQRVAVMLAGIETFEKKVRALRQNLAEEGSDRGAEDVVEDLHRALVKAREAAGVHLSLTEQLEKARLRRDHAGRKRDLLLSRRDELHALAGTSDPEELRRRLEITRRARRLDGEIADLARDLDHLRGKTPLSEFRKRLEESDRGVLEARLREAEGRARELDGATGLAHQELGETRRRLEELDGTSRAAEVAAEIEGLRSELYSSADRYAKLVFARGLVRRALDRFERSHQPGLLREVTRIFTRLTSGRYVQVKRRLDAGGSLVVLQHDGAEKEPRQLSTGTREQLWLSIRLAYVVEYCRHSEPLPVIMDDVLVNFDDERARRTLEVLGELGQALQIVLLTCHGRTVERARAVIPDLEPLVLDRDEVRPGEQATLLGRLD
jgi:uncharacterized protein YhaN